MKMLMTGGTGLLGSEIKKLNKQVVSPSRSVMDLNFYHTIVTVLKHYRPDCVLHLAAKTDPPIHDTNPERGILNNIIGTANLALVCLQRNIRLVYLSSDYVYVGPGPHNESDPVNAPSNFIWSKLGGECSVRMIPKSLVIRCSFGPRPFPHKSVYDNQQNSKMYVDEIAPLVLKAAFSEVTGVLNIGSNGQTLEEYAHRSKPNIQTIETPDWVPPDTRLNTNLWKSHFST